MGSILVKVEDVELGRRQKEKCMEFCVFAQFFFEFFVNHVVIFSHAEAFSLDWRWDRCFQAVASPQPGEMIKVNARVTTRQKLRSGLLGQWGESQWRGTSVQGGAPAMMGTPKLWASVDRKYCSWPCGKNKTQRNEDGQNRKNKMNGAQSA